jgi:hypothetical protein
MDIGIRKYHLIVNHLKEQHLYPSAKKGAGYRIIVGIQAFGSPFMLDT